MTIAAVLGHFSHGLVFFTLGLTVSFLHYRSRRISLARHLGWLGGFAMGEALYAWYEILAMLLPAGRLLPVVVPPSSWCPPTSASWSLGSRRLCRRRPTADVAGRCGWL